MKKGFIFLMPRLLIEIDEHSYVFADVSCLSVRCGWRLNILKQMTYITWNFSTIKQQINFLDSYLFKEMKKNVISLMPRLLIEIDEHLYVTVDGSCSSVHHVWRLNILKQITSVTLH